MDELIAGTGNTLSSWTIPIHHAGVERIWLI